MIKECRECKQQVSDEALICPHCGAPRSARDSWDGFGYEYKSKIQFFGLPLVHISFKFSKRFMPKPAIGVISIGQFGAGIINISQFGIGVFSLSQFTIAVFAICQIGIAHSLIAQIGFYIGSGYGQIVQKIF